MAGNQWQKDKEARVLGGQQENSWSGGPWRAACRLLSGGKAMTDDGLRGKGRIWGLAYS